MAVQTEHSLRLGVEIKKKLKEFDLDISFRCSYELGRIDPLTEVLMFSRR